VKTIDKTTAGLAIFLVASSGAAMAQEQSSEAIDEVVVTGLRKSIQDSINVKKEESSIVEVVSAEDIGKLPDASIAEAIGRLPGIAAQRTNGRAQTLSIRGLGPDFTVTTSVPGWECHPVYPPGANVTSTICASAFALCLA